MNANIHNGPIWPIVLGGCLALAVPVNASAELVAPGLSTHTQDIALLADGPFVIDPQSHYLNVHSLARASVFERFGPTNPSHQAGANRSGGAAAGSAGSGGGQDGTDAEQQKLALPTEPPSTTFSVATVIAGHEIPQTWATDPVAPPGATVPQVPIPFAAVLFGSALLWLIGFRLRAPRKRS